MVAEEEQTSVRIGKSARDKLKELAEKNEVSQAEYLDKLVKYAHEQGLTMETEVNWKADKGWTNENT